mmetsp:Transcript_45093/g.143611  ORF Transcript_45093/g.143611 Transcript_45093/m.143611 type:complete len:223 (+) Transcript_45093:162-830(+)
MWPHSPSISSSTGPIHLEYASIPSRPGCSQSGIVLFTRCFSPARSTMNMDSQSTKRTLCSRPAHSRTAAFVWASSGVYLDSLRGRSGPSWHMCVRDASAVGRPGWPHHCALGPPCSSCRCGLAEPCCHVLGRIDEDLPAPPPPGGAFHRLPFFPGFLQLRLEQRSSARGSSATTTTSAEGSALRTVLATALMPSIACSASNMHLPKSFVPIRITTALGERVP